uniref:Protein SIEVE ELEMENT OCCLUSION B-like n=1 Tax=Nelumbo nucifera TaxID=4432 RepID=A0A822ZKV7_NELNU|nr:TPA_asm: hypothetical protein HUJ06_003747 [Nelumbo nucifera]
MSMFGSFYSLTSEEEAIIQQIQHGPKNQDFEFNPLMDVINQIFKLIPFSSEMGLEQSGHQGSNDKSIVTSVERLELQDSIRGTIHSLSWEITCKAACGTKPHEATLALFDTLKMYSWEAKVVLVMSAFAMNYGEFWLTAQPLSDNPLFTSVRMLKHFPSLLQTNSRSLKSRFELISNLVRRVHAMANNFMGLKLYKTQTDRSVKLSLQIAVYYIIRSLYTCISSNMVLVKMGAEYTMSATGDIHDELTRIYKLASPVDKFLYESYITEKDFAGYEELLKFQTQYEDNIKLIKKLFSTEELILYQRSVMEKVSLDKLKGKSIAFFISDLMVNAEEFSALAEAYNIIKRKENFEVVWLPIVDQAIKTPEQSFVQVAAQMPWFCLLNTSCIHKCFVLHIKYKWNFHRKPILVVLNKQGVISHTNALPMVKIWGAQAYPFYEKTEVELWKRESGGVEFLVKGFAPDLKTWDEKIVCFYGGHDLDWIRPFAEGMSFITKETKVQMETIYVGTKRRKERLQKILNCIRNEKLSRVWDEKTIGSFWHRIENISYSKMAHCNAYLEDAIMKELMIISSYDDNEDGWALMLGGSSDLKTVRFSGRQLSLLIKDFEKWGSRAIGGHEDFLTALNEYVRGSHTCRAHCIRLIVPMGAANNIPETVKCSECDRSMEKYLLYKCCTE